MDNNTDINNTDINNGDINTANTNNEDINNENINNENLSNANINNANTYTTPSNNYYNVNNSTSNQGYNANNFNSGNYVYNQNNYMPSIIESLSGWMKFLGIYTIIIGAITCLGIITAALGIPMIFSGIGLTNASKSLKEYREYNNQFTLNDFFSHLNKYFKIQGIFAIIGIVLSVLYIAFILVFLIVGLYSYNYGY